MPVIEGGVEHEARMFVLKDPLRALLRQVRDVFGAEEAGAAECAKQTQSSDMEGAGAGNPGCRPCLFPGERGGAPEPAEALPQLERHRAVQVPIGVHLKHHDVRLVAPQPLVDQVGQGLRGPDNARKRLHQLAGLLLEARGGEAE